MGLASVLLCQASMLILQSSVFKHSASVFIFRASVFNHQASMFIYFGSVFTRTRHIKKALNCLAIQCLNLGRGERLKEFIGTFLACVIVCSIFSFFFLGLIVEYIWFAIILVAFVFAVLITAFIKQEARIEELEQRVEQFLSSSAQN